MKDKNIIYGIITVIFLVILFSGKLQIQPQQIVGLDYNQFCEQGNTCQGTNCCYQWPGANAKYVVLTGQCSCDSTCP